MSAADSGIATAIRHTMWPDQKPEREGNDRRWETSAVSEPTYTLTLTDSERVTLSKAFGMLVEKLANCRIQIESPTGGTQAARAVLSPASTPSPSRGRETAASPAIAQPNSPPIVLRDRWARDRNGNEIANPEGCESFDARVSKVDKIPAKADKKEYFKITWESPSGKGFGDANFFDPQLFAACATQIGKKTTLHVVRNGKYLNLVGVRA